MSELEHPNDEMSEGQEWSPGLGACEPIITVMTAVPRVWLCDSCRQKG